MRHGIPALILLVVCGTSNAQSQESLDFVGNHTDFRQIRNMLPVWARGVAERHLQARLEAVAHLSTAVDWAGRKTLLREKLIRALGGFPDRTPLNPRVAGRLEREGVRIEKIIFESQPGFFVTANLYLPLSGGGPFPGILFPLGHEEGAKAHHAWQRLLITFAKRGFVALAWDTIGQGERVQLFDPDFEGSKVVRSTTEHTILGTQCLLTGEPLARYTIWDGIRALDYLLSRPEVDPKRVGCTGNSGGGTHTAYLSALDDRIQVAAPSCYLTTWSDLLDTIGPQDAEQCIPPSISDGLDHADFVHAFAPKPYLILSAIRDFFSIGGARHTYQEASRHYAALGASDRLSMFEYDDGHGYSKPRREAAYRWFSRWLQGSENINPEPAMSLSNPEELNCTPSGQVSVSLGGETVSSLTLKRTQQFQRAPEPAAETVRRLIGFSEPPSLPAAVGYGALSFSGYRAEKLVYESEPGIKVPAVLFVPENLSGRRPAAVVVHGRGKSAAAVEARQLVSSGWVVLAIDARGLGETRHVTDEYGSDWPRYFGDFESAMTLLLSGKTLLGGRVLDIVQGVNLLAARPEVDAARIAGIGIAGGCVPLLHAAALDSRIQRAAFDGMLVSYMAVVRQKINRGVFEDVVPGVLKSYDLPGLARSVSPRQLWLIDTADPVGSRLGLEIVRKEYPSENSHLVLRRPGEEGIEPYREVTSGW